MEQIKLRIEIGPSAIVRTEGRVTSAQERQVVALMAEAIAAVHRAQRRCEATPSALSDEGGHDE